jgi:steroid delta-isomerase-like uncharacterized protein
MTQTPAMAVDAELRARREAVIREHVAAENRHDPAGTVATFHGQARYDVPALGPLALVDGAEAVHAFLAGMFVSFPDFHAETGPLHHADDVVFLEARITGTHQGDFAGIPPSGRCMDIRIACLFEFEGNRLTCEKVYMDMATVLQQLGAMPTPEQ